MQLRVNRRTKSFDKLTPEGSDLDDGKNEQVGHIARKQGTIGDLARRMAERLNKED